MWEGDPERQTDGPERSLREQARDQADREARTGRPGRQWGAGRDREQGIQTHKRMEGGKERPGRTSFNQPTFAKHALSARPGGHGALGSQQGTRLAGSRLLWRSLGSGYWVGWRREFCLPAPSPSHSPSTPGWDSCSTGEGAESCVSPSRGPAPSLTPSNRAVCQQELCCPVPAVWEGAYLPCSPLPHTRAHLHTGWEAEGERMKEQGKESLLSFRAAVSSSVKNQGRESHTSKGSREGNVRGSLRGFTQRLAQLNPS